MDTGKWKEYPDGLIICNMEGVQQGFIETGGQGEVVIK